MPPFTQLHVARARQDHKSGSEDGLFRASPNYRHGCAQEGGSSCCASSPLNAPTCCLSTTTVPCSSSNAGLRSQAKLPIVNFGLLLSCCLWVRVRNVVKESSSLLSGSRWPHNTTSLASSQVFQVQIWPILTKDAPSRSRRVLVSTRTHHIIFEFHFVSPSQL